MKLLPTALLAVLASSAHADPASFKAYWDSQPKTPEAYLDDGAKSMGGTGFLSQVEKVDLGWPHPVPTYEYNEKKLVSSERARELLEASGAAKEEGEARAAAMRGERERENRDRMDKARHEGGESGARVEKWRQEAAAGYYRQAEDMQSLRSNLLAAEARAAQWKAERHSDELRYAMWKANLDFYDAQLKAVEDESMEPARWSFVTDKAWWFGKQGVPEFYFSPETRADKKVLKGLVMRAERLIEDRRKEGRWAPDGESYRWARMVESNWYFKTQQANVNPDLSFAGQEAMREPLAALHERYSKIVDRVKKYDLRAVDLAKTFDKLSREKVSAREKSARDWEEEQEARNNPGPRDARWEAFLDKVRERNAAELRYVAAAQKKAGPNPSAAVYQEVTDRLLAAARSVAAMFPSEGDRYPRVREARKYYERCVSQAEPETPFKRAFLLDGCFSMFDTKFPRR